MKRGSTHDSDKSSFTTLVPTDELNESLDRLRDAQVADMRDRRAADPGGDRQ
jgi:hypothetical protein